MPEGRIALEVRDLTIQFGGLTAVNSVSLAVPDGARYGVLGPNGAGKTTLFNAMTGTITPTSGTIWLNGEDVTRLPTHLRARKGLVRTFQITTLFQDMTILENVMMASLVQSGEDGVFFRPAIGMAKAVSLAQHQLENLQLDHLANRLGTELGYGEQRLLEIAIALASQPRVLLLDEPTAGAFPCGDTGSCKTHPSAAR